MNTHDTAQRDLFAEREMVASLVRTFAAELGLSPEEVEQLDFGAMERGPSDFIWEGRLVRYADRVWEIPVRGAPAGGRSSLHLLLEIQASHHPRMGSRMMIYAGMLHDALRRALKLKPSEPRPKMLSIVLHHGKTPWALVTDMGNFKYHLIDLASCDLNALPDDEVAACWARCESAQTQDEMEELLLKAFDAAPEDEDRDLRRALHTRVASQSGRDDFPSFEEFEAKWRGDEPMAGMLAESFKRWDEEKREEGRVEGRMEEHLKNLEAQRALLRMQAGERFGVEVSERLSELIDRIEDSEGFAEVGRSIVACGTGEELLERVANGHLPNGAPDAGSSD